VLNVKGQGINNVVDLKPENIKLSPVLPYEPKSIESFEIMNPMEHPIEVYSLDFDRQYLEEEEIIKRMENFSVTGANEPIYLPYRKAGSEFWPSIKKADEVKRQTEEIKAEIRKIDDDLNELCVEEQQIADFQAAKDVDKESGTASPDQLPEPKHTQEEISDLRNQYTARKGELDGKLHEIAQDNLEVKLPPAVKEHKKLNLVMVGPNGVGKTLVANYMAQEHQRCIVRLDMLLDYWQKRGHAVAEEATKFLEDKQAELEVAQAELEKQKKAKKPKKGEPEPEINVAEYKLLPRELLVKMIQLRVQEEDCNAGVIFDCLTSENWTDENFAIGLISEAVPIQNVQLLMFNFKHEEFAWGDEETREVEVCTNIRYAQRHDNKMRAKKQQKQEEIKEATERNTPRPAKKAPAGKSMKKDKKSTEELEQANVEAEAERLRKKAEAEAAALEAAEQKKDKIRPKEYSAEDKTNWREYAKTVTENFGNIIAKNLNEKDEDPDKEFGRREIVEVNVEYNYTYLCEYLCTVIEDPEWPDPDKEPLPPPVISSILKKPPNRAERNKITKFSIFTPSGEV
jgi:hydrocephalus-inducing protein